MSADSGDLPLKGPARAEYEAEMEVQTSAWMSRAKQGDPTAFDELTVALRNRAFHLAHSWVGSREDALELAQEAFLKTYRARDTYRDGEPFLPWFHRILRNTCFSFLRQTKRLRKTSLSAGREEDESDWEIADDDVAPDDGVDAEERRGVFWQGFHKLSARDREIIALRHFQELSYSAIARRLAIPDGTVMSRLFHARARLRAALADYFDEDGAAQGPAQDPKAAPAKEGRKR